MAKRLEIRRHSYKGQGEDEDILTPEGIKYAVWTGLFQLRGNYTHLYISGLQRTAQTLCCFLAGMMGAGMGKVIPNGVVVDRGLATPYVDDWGRAIARAGAQSLTPVQKTDPALIIKESQRMAQTFRQILEEMPKEGYALVVGHSPLAECGIYGLTGKVYSDLKECEGFIITLEDDGTITIEERRL